MAFTRTTTINSAPGGDSTKQAVLDLDTDLTGAFGHLNTLDSTKLATATAGTTYAPIAKGVTNGDTHDHSGGDGAQIAYSNLSGLPTFGTISSQAANNVSITGGTINGTTIGDTTPAAGAFTTLSSTGNILVGTATDDGVHKLQVKGGGYFGYPGELQVKVHHTSANKILSLGADGATSYLLSNNGITFYVNNGASQMILDSSGNLLVGYTSSNGSYKLQVNSQIFATSSTIATSDVRYKTDIQTITDGLAIIHKLRPVQFNWKEHPVHAFDRTHPTTGFIAQETLEALSGKPYAASIVKSNDCKLPDGTTEEFLGIAEGNLISIIVSAIQELSAKVTTLEEQLNAA